MATHSPQTWDAPSFAPGLTLDLGEGPSAWASPGSNEKHHSFSDHGLVHDHEPNESNAAPADWNDAVLAYIRADDAKAALPALRLRIAEVEECLMQNEAILLALKRMNQEAHETQRTDEQPSSSRTCSFAMLWKWFGRPSSVQVPIRLPRPMFQASYTAEANVSRQVETMHLQVTDLKAEDVEKEQLGSGLADCFEVVCELADIYLPSVAASQSVDLMLASHRLRDADESVENNRRLLANISVILSDLQASHLLLGEVLNTIDASRESERRARGSFAPMAQMEVVNQYKGEPSFPRWRTRAETRVVAVKFAQEAQAKLDAGLQVLMAHSLHIPVELDPHVQSLRSGGVSQAQRMFTTKYQESSLSSAARDRQLDVLNSAQLAAYSGLTEVAVWLQKYVLELQEGTKAAEERRRLARRQMVELWHEILCIGVQRRGNRSPSASGHSLS